MSKAQRKAFEDAVFNQRFLSGVKKTGTGQFPFTVDCPTQKEFVTKKPDGSYIEATLNAAWWAWQEAQKEHLDTKRLAVIRKMMGYVENGSHETVTIGQDDATRSFSIRSGNKRRYFGDSFSGMLDAAIEAEKKIKEDWE